MSGTKDSLRKKTPHIDWEEIDFLSLLLAWTEDLKHGAFDDPPKRDSIFLKIIEKSS